MTISMSNLEFIISPISFSLGDKLEVLVRTKEGAEATQILDVVA